MMTDTRASLGLGQAEGASPSRGNQDESEKVTLDEAVKAYALNCQRCYGYTPDAREVAAVLHLRGSKTILETVREVIKGTGQ